MRDLTLYLIRHGDTAWSPERRLAGRTDLPLTTAGEESARRLGARLRAARFDRVLVSPLTRARRTAELAGFDARAEVDARLIELDFGQFEGLTVAEVRSERPGWTYLGDGCPDGESPEDIGARVDAFLTDLRGTQGEIALFAHSVLLRVLTARFLGLPPGAGRNLMMAPAAISVLQYDPVEDAPAISAWNDRQHLADADPLFRATR